MPAFAPLYLPAAHEIIERDVRAGLKIYICRWNGSGPVILVTEKTVYLLMAARKGKTHGLLWWRWNTALWREIEEGIYGYDRV